MENPVSAHSGGVTGGKPARQRYEECISELLALQGSIGERTAESEDGLLAIEIGGEAVAFATIEVKMSDFGACFAAGFERKAIVTATLRNAVIRKQFQTAREAYEYIMPMARKINHFFNEIIQQL